MTATYEPAPLTDGDRVRIGDGPHEGTWTPWVGSPGYRGSVLLDTGTTVNVPLGCPVTVLPEVEPEPAAWTWCPKHSPTDKPGAHGYVQCADREARFRQMIDCCADPLGRYHNAAALARAVLDAAGGHTSGGYCSLCTFTPVLDPPEPREVQPERAWQPGDLTVRVPHLVRPLTHLVPATPDAER